MPHIYTISFNVIYRFEIYLFREQNIHPPFEVIWYWLKTYQNKRTKSIPIHGFQWSNINFVNWYMKLISFRSFIRNCKVVPLMIAIFYAYTEYIRYSHCNLTLWGFCFRFLCRLVTKFISVTFFFNENTGLLFEWGRFSRK